jgi:D-alanyl-D-alanine carboxypeptidase
VTIIEPVAVLPPSVRPSTPAFIIRSVAPVVDNIARARSIVAPKTMPNIQLNGQQMQLLRSIMARLTRVQNYYGYGNFNIIGFDQAIRIAKRQSSIGEFTRIELDFIEEIFFTNARSLGFYGDKVIDNLSATIDKKDVLKIPASGHYLFKGIANDTYGKIRKDLGDSVVLTSGIRGVVKQIYLYLNKVRKLEGNLSLASFSLAPPGHSYHAIGDFDVGKKGFGRKNFTAEFAKTDEFKRLIDLGYLDIRYPPQNPYGVRYEPWHIKVV